MSGKRRTLADEEFFVVRSSAAGLASGSLIERHQHEWHQLIYAASGVMTVWTERGSWVTPPHWAIWVPAGVVHSIRFAGLTEMRTLYLRPGRTRAMPAGCTVIAVSDFLRALILRAVDLGVLDRRASVDRALATLLLDALRTQPTPAFDLPLPEAPELRRVAEDLLRDPADGASGAAIAARIGVGIRTLERRFAAETGLSFGRWRRQARFAHALRELAAGRAVKVVAAEAGYHSASAFVAAFQEVFGTTPGRYFAAA